MKIKTSIVIAQLAESGAVVDSADWAAVIDSLEESHRIQFQK